MIAEQKHVNITASYELVTVMMRQIDYSQLTSRGLPMDVQVSLALQHYLLLVEEGRWLADSAALNPPPGKWKSVRCAIARQICDQLRGLPGRFDLHALQAVRLYLL